MPYQWLPPSDAQIAHLSLWAHRSLPRRGFVGFIALTCLLVALPLLVHLGSPALWVLLPFLLATIAGLWIALQRSYHDGKISEDLILTATSLTLEHHNPEGKTQSWQANPHWVRLELHPTGGRVAQYLVLKGGPRPVELGAFLAEEERIALHQDLARLLKDCR
jgi:uncharacterized membrane protein